MFFYVDESGHTGLNIFDEAQPFLYYGVLSSKTNIDVLAASKIIALRKRLGVDRLHAAELGNGRLIEVIDDITELKKKYGLKIDFHRVSKRDHALICFFDQTFDQGLNPAVPWNAYWTPLKYVLLVKLSRLFDDNLLKKAWDTRITQNNAKAEKILREICEVIINRVHIIPDERSRQIITDAMRWVIKNTSKIGYNATSKESSRQISPNLIGFQSVMFDIAERLKKHKSNALKIIVDQQSEFNIAQKFVADFYTKGRDLEPTPLGLALPILDLKHMPKIPISCISGKESIGLELVDIFIWIFKRHSEEKNLAPELFNLIEGAKYEEVSLNGLIKRWEPWLLALPEPSEEGMIRARNIMDKQEKERLLHVV